MKVLPRFWYGIAIFLILLLLNTNIHLLILSRLLYFCVFLLAFGFLWAFFSLRGVTFYRVTSQSRYDCGEVLEENYQLQNNSIFPKLWVKVEDLSSLPAQPASMIVTRVKAKQTRFYQSMLVLDRRGEFALGPTRLTSGDPFGFFSIQKTIPAVASILVFPLISPWSELWHEKGNLSGGKAHRETHLSFTPNASGVRDYQQGDPLNRIHWKTSTRAQKWMVKEFDQDPLANYWIILDGSASSHVENISPTEVRFLNPREAHLYQPQTILPRDSFEYGISIAASFCGMLINAGRGVGFFCSGQKVSSISPERGERQKIKILEELVYLLPGGNNPFGTELRSQAGVIRKGNAALIISSAPPGELLTPMDLLIRKGIPVHFVFVDPSGFGQVGNFSAPLEKIRDLGISIQTIQPK